MSQDRAVPLWQSRGDHSRPSSQDRRVFSVRDRAGYNVVAISVRGMIASDLRRFFRSREKRLSGHLGAGIDPRHGELLRTLLLLARGIAPDEGDLLDPPRREVAGYAPGYFLFRASRALTGGEGI